MQTEPVLTGGAIAGAVGAILVALVTLGVISLSPEQQAAVLAALVAVLPIATALWARAKVTPLIDPKVTLPSGETVPLVRADNQQPTPQAMQATKEKWERGE